MYLLQRHVLLINRNNHIIYNFIYEATVGLMINSASGASNTTGPRSAGGKYIDYITPVEAWWCGQVFKSCGAMKLEKVNELAKALIPKYENQLNNPPKGKSITECFNLQTLEPTLEYSKLYSDIEQELIDLGMPLRKIYE